MANETVLTGLAHPTDVYSDIASAALINRAVVMKLIYAENIPADTTVKYLRKNGYLASSTSAVSEGANYSTNSQWSTTGIAITAIKDVVSSFVTVEAERFGRADRATIFREQGAALARRLDAEIVALFAGFTTGVTSTALCTVKDIMDAAYAVRAGTKDAGALSMTAVLSMKSVNAIRNELLTTAASAFTIETNLSVLGAQGGEAASIQATGFVGTLPGVEIYQYAGAFATGSGDDTQAVFDRTMAIGGMYDPSIQTMAIQTANGNPSFGTSYSSYIFHGAAEWNDLAGCMLKSDT